MWFVPDDDVRTPFSWPVEVRVILLVLLIVIILFLAPMAFFFGATWIEELQEYYNRQPFDSVAWKSPHEFHGETRIRMVDDLIARHKLKGKSRDAIISLLGKPDNTKYFSGWDMVYWLGPKRGFMPIDSEWLVLKFSNRDTVSEFAVVAD